MEELIMTIGKNIKVLREGMGMTQEQMAGKLNISYQAISKWENSQNCSGYNVITCNRKDMRCNN